MSTEVIPDDILGSSRSHNGYTAYQNVTPRLLQKPLWNNHLAPVAQLDRASVFGTGGWGFESLRAYS